MKKKFAILLSAVAVLCYFFLGSETKTANHPVPDLPAATTRSLQSDLSGAHVRKVMKLVADSQIADPPRSSLLMSLIGETDTRQWNYSTFYLGVAAWAEAAHDPHYRDYLRRQGELNEWRLTDDLYHADGQLVGSTYLALARKFDKPEDYRALRERFDTILAAPPESNSLEHPETDITFVLFESETMRRWIWADALFMAPATWIELSNVTGDPRYTAYADREFWVMHELLYDPEESLYYRDSRFVDMRDDQGEKIFWARGNGWVIAGLARILAQLPADYPTRQKYEAAFATLAARLARLQSPEGYWPSSLLPGNSLQTPESSGTALITFALAWGVNNGLLSSEEYRPVVAKGWRALVGAVHQDGRLGWVQTMGDRPASSSFQGTSLYGAGALLLAGSEILKFPPAPDSCSADAGVDVEITNPSSDVELKSATLEIDARQEGVNALSDCAGRTITVFDPDSRQYLLSQDLDTDYDGKTDTLLFQLTLAPGQSRTVQLGLSEEYPLPAIGGVSYGRIVPERDDDFAWENNRIAFRVYGPALEQKGEISSGIDVWGKRVGRNVVNDWYKNGQSLLHNYHQDHGEGADFYKVGETLGVGGNGLWKDGRLHMPANFSRARVLATGPIRMVAELDYDHWQTPSGGISFTRRITLDRNRQLFRIEVLFDHPPAESGSMVAGLNSANGEVVEQTWSDKAGIYALWSELGEKWGQLGTAVVIPQQAEESEAPIIGDNQFLIRLGSPRNDRLTYFAGACWSRSGHCDNASDWNDELQEFSATQRVEPGVRILGGAAAPPTRFSLTAGFALLGPDFPDDRLAPETSASRLARAAAETVGRARDALERPPSPRARIHVEGTLPGEGIADASWKALEDVPIALALAIAWRLTGERAYLDQAGRYLAAWAGVYELSLNPIDETFLSDLILAYDLTEEDLPSDVRANVDALLTRMAQGYLRAMETGDIRRGTGNINWQSHRVKLATLAAFQLGDASLVERAQDAFQKQIAANLQPDGAPIDFVIRDALHYVVFTLEPLLEAALAAQNHGLDWYRWQSPEGAHLGQSLDWLAVYARGEKSHVEYVNSLVPFDRERREAGVRGFDNRPWKPSGAAEVYALASLLDPHYAHLSDVLSREKHAKTPPWLILAALPAGSR